jgi:hypothetical protein
VPVQRKAVQKGDDEYGGRRYQADQQGFDKTVDFEKGNPCDQYGYGNRGDGDHELVACVS